MTEIRKFRDAVELQEQGKHEEALTQFEALGLFESDPDWKRTLLQNQATCLWSLGRLSEARQKLQQALALGPNASIEFMDARLSYFEGDVHGALPKFTAFLQRHSALRDDANDRVLYFDAVEQRGHCLFELGNYAEAVPLYKDALLFFQGNRRKKINYRLGVCCQRIGDVDYAVRSFQESLPEDRDDPWWTYGQYQLGCLFFKAGLLGKAKEAFESCRTDSIHVDPEYRKNVAAWLERLKAESSSLQ